MGMGTACPKISACCLGLQASQHLAQRCRAGDAGEDGANVVLFIEQCRDPRPNLTHDLGVDAARSLIDDEQRDVVLTHLSRDRPEDGVPCDGGVEELMRLLDGDHQGARLRSLPSEVLLLSV